MRDATSQGKPPNSEAVIPFFDLGQAGPLALMDEAAQELDAILMAGRRHHGTLALRIGDAISESWLRKSSNPYLEEIRTIAARIDGPGAFLLNLSYEWSCTTGVGPDPSGHGMRMLRTLDWPMEGLGCHVVVSRRETAVGEVYEVTWPGFTGMLTAMAPGRFAAAINQPPIRKRTPWCWTDWALSRLTLWSTSALPPPHLLRQVFEQCTTFEEAKKQLSETPLAIPAFFSLAGTAPGEACVIERTEDRFAVHESPASIANHWCALAERGRDRGVDSRGRLAAMDRCRDEAVDGFGWVVPPILNTQTRLAIVANAAASRLMVRGYEDALAVTAPFTLEEPHRVETAKTTPAPPAAVQA